MKSLRTRLYIIAFLAGFSLMVFELAAARILAPSIGSSTYVWTSVIGVIIAALSLGYYLGGKLADYRKTAIDIAYVSLLAALMVVLMMSSYPGVLSWSVDTFTDSRLQGFVVSLILFAPTSVLLGMLQPYLVKQNVKSLESSGRSVANLSALDAIGGIIGTFTAGFILFGIIGSRETLLVVAIILIIISWLILPRHRIGWRLMATLAVVLFGLTSHQATSGNRIAIDTPSAHYEIVRAIERESERSVVGIMTGPRGVQSAIYPDHPDELVFWYTNELAKIVDDAPEKKNILMLGGGTFTLPQYLAHKYPDSNIDVVEIDPALEGIAREYFNYQSPDNVNLIFDDARSFLNTAQGKYDAIVVDVYGDASVPFSLITDEYGQHIARLSGEKTVIAVNMIAGMEDACGELAEYYSAPYNKYFEYASYWRERPVTDRGNLIAAFSNYSDIDRPGKFSIKKVEPLTDDFAPSEHLQQACLNYNRS